MGCTHVDQLQPVVVGASKGDVSSPVPASSSCSRRSWHQGRAFRAFPSPREAVLSLTPSAMALKDVSTQLGMGKGARAPAGIYQE